MRRREATGKASLTSPWSHASGKRVAAPATFVGMFAPARQSDYR